MESHEFFRLYLCTFNVRMSTLQNSKSYVHKCAQPQTQPCFINITFTSMDFPYVHFKNIFHYLILIKPFYNNSFPPPVHPNIQYILHIQYTCSVQSRPYCFDNTKSYTFVTKFFKFNAFTKWIHSIKSLKYGIVNLTCSDHKRWSWKQNNINNHT